jgi:hypothetical protein
MALVTMAPAQNAPAVPAAAPAATQGGSGSMEVPDAAEVMTPDTRPLTGAQQLTFGSPDRPSFLVPRLHFSELVDTNPGITGTDSNPTALTTITGGLELQRRSRTSELSLHYQGGGAFYAKRDEFSAFNQPNSTFQGVGISQHLTFGRWSLLASDEVSYVSAGSSSLGAASGLSLGSVPMTSLAGLNSAFIPAQNRVEQAGSSVSNSVVMEADYLFGPRSAITVTGSYGILHFPDGGLLNSDQKGAAVGYNRTLTAHDTIGVSYGFTAYGYDNFDASVWDHTLYLMYGRRVTGRLSLRLAGGASVVQFRGADPEDSRASWSAEGGLHYALRATDLNVSYSRAINGGSGVDLAANSDVVQGGVTRTIFRRWMASSGVGYSRNMGLRSGLISGLNSSLTYSTLFVNAGVRRQIGRYTGIDITYSFQRQSGVVPCLSCGDEVLRHTIGVGFDWGFRPIRLQ